MGRRSWPSVGCGARRSVVRAWSGSSLALPPTPIDGPIRSPSGNQVGGRGVTAPMDTPTRFLRTAALVAAVALALVGCGGGSGSSDRGTAPSPEPSTTTAGAGGSAGDASSRGGEAPAAPGSDAGAVAEDEAAGSTGGPSPAPSADPSLAAGRVDDGDRWEEYLLYRAEAGRQGIPLAPLDVDARRVVTVRDVDDRPVRGAVVDVLDADGGVEATVRTHADGRAVVFSAPGATAADDQQQGETTGYRVRSEAGDATVEVGPDVVAPVLRTPGARPTDAPDLDLHFVVDATGSMGDEIERLKATLASVVEGIGELPGAPDVRLGMTVYRDQGDAFVTRSVPFTTDVDAFAEELREVTADGGGDTPEAVEPALAAALDGVEWSTDPGTVKLAFLVADAPPHLEGLDAGCGPVPPGAEAPVEGGAAPEAAADEVAPPEPCAGTGTADDSTGVGAEDGPHYLDSATRFAEAGIKVVPVASSNLDPVGESVFRELALVTQAPFLFLTYGADGASPGDQRPDLHVDDFAVLSLDQMVARVVADELTATA